MLCYHVTYQETTVPMCSYFYLLAPRRTNEVPVMGRVRDMQETMCGINDEGPRT